MSFHSFQQHSGRPSIAGRAFAGFLLAAMGVVVAHGLGYLSSYPRAAMRREALEGHAHLEALGALFVVGGVATAVMLVAFAVRHIGTLRHMTPTWPKLARWQVTGFLALEFVERLGSPGDFLTEPAILIGALIQIPVAWLLVRAINVGVAVMSRADFSGARVSVHWLAPALDAISHSPRLVPCMVRCSATSPRGPPTRLV